MQATAAGTKRTAPTRRGLGGIYHRTVKEADGTEREIPTWHVHFSVNGQQYRESTHTESYNEAQKYLKRRITEVATGKFLSTQIDRTLMSELFADVIADYELKDRHNVDSMARHLIDKYLLPHFGKMRAANVKVPVITAYMKSRKDAGRAVASINRELGLLRRAFTLGAANGKVGPANMPNFKGLFQKEKNARQGFWEHSEYEAFRDALPIDERGPFIFGYWTGRRLGEILSLEWLQVDLEGRAVRLRADQTKPGEARIIPLGGPAGDLYAMLVAQKQRHADLCPESPWVFFRQGSKHVNRESPRRGMQVTDIRKGWAKAVETTKTLEAAQTLGIWPEDVTDEQRNAAKGIDRLFHDLRRTGVRNLIRAGVPQKVAMMISGHKTTSMFSRYNIVDERDLHDAADKLAKYLNGKNGNGQK
jgi:integrase